MPTRTWMSRGWAIATGIAAMVALTTPLARADQQEEAPVEASTDLTVGTRLEALDNVTLSRAEIAKGSTVSVTKLLHRQGRLASVDVALADGMVARVGIDKVRSLFRVLGE